MNRRSFLTLAIAGAAAAGLSACSPGQETSSGPSTAPVAATEGSADAIPSPSEFYPGLPAASWDDTAAADALKAAKTAMGAFVDVVGGQEAWWGRYAPLLASSYAEDAFHIDVHRITITRFADPELVNETGNPLTVQAVFATDSGAWEMLLHRVGETSPWLVHSLGRKEDQ